jgi:hypothetical protein
VICEAPDTSIFASVPVIDNTTPLAFSTLEDTSLTITQAELLANAEAVVAVSHPLEPDSKSSEAKTTFVLVRSTVF